MLAGDTTDVAATGTGPAARGRPAVVVVEDDRRIGELLRHLVETEGYDAQVCPDGLTALGHMKASAPPAAVLLDLMLPHRSGLQLLEAIRSDARWQDVPVVILTGNADEQQMIRGLDSGADDYLTKPFSPDELLARLRRLVRRSTPRPAPAAGNGCTP